MKFYVCLVLNCLVLGGFSQSRQGFVMVANNLPGNFSGMSIPDEKVIWVSGSSGTIAKSIDGGNTWHTMQVKGYEQRDFRDIEAFDSSTAIAMAVDNPAIIVKTVDGGKSWKKVFERKAQGMFLDAMDFRNKLEGICIGDPINLVTGRRLFYIIRTYDGGNTWNEIPMIQMPPALAGEALFAASGTNISFINHTDFEYAFVTGGSVANMYFMAKPGKNNKLVNVPIIQGRESAGIFSFATDKLEKYYCIGGDYKLPKDYFDNYFYTTDAGYKWKSASVGPPVGYRSCVRIISGNSLIACGTTGIDYAKNGHKEWNKISLEGFNVCMVASKNTVFFAGNKGRIGKVML